MGETICIIVVLFTSQIIAKYNYAFTKVQIRLNMSIISFNVILI